MSTDKTRQKPAFLQRVWRKYVHNPEFRGQNITYGNNAWDRFFDDIGIGKDQDSGQKVSAEAGTSLGIVFNCLNTIAQDIATFPPKLHTDQDGQKLTLKTDFSRLISRRPNPFENAWHFWYGMVFMGEGWESSYAYVAERDNMGYATKLLRLKPWLVSPEIIEGELYYNINNQVAIHARDIFHYRSFVTDDPFGRSKIEWNKKTIGLKLKEHKFKAKAIGNKPNIVILMDGTPEQVEQSRDNWNRQVSGDDIAGTPFLMGSTLDVKNLSFSPENAQIVEQSKASDEDIMGIWRLQPAMIGRHEKSSYNLSEQQAIIHVKHTLLPIATNLEQEMYKLMPEGTNEYVKFNFKSLLRGDTKTQTEFYKFLRFYGIANANTILALEDMPPLPGDIGERIFIQSSMTEVRDGQPLSTDADEMTDERMIELWEGFIEARGKKDMDQALDEFAQKHKLNGYAQMQDA